MSSKKRDPILDPHFSDDHKKQTSSQSFDKIGLMEAMHGDVILRGRNGERDHLIPLDKAIEKYYTALDAVMVYLRNGQRGWDTLKDIADDLKHRILEAIEQRRKIGRPVLEDALKFEHKEKK